MTHAMRIRVSKEKLNGGLLTCRSVTIRERLLRFLLGRPTKLTIIVPGDSVDEVGISEIPPSDTEQEALHKQNGRRYCCLQGQLHIRRSVVQLQDQRCDWRNPGKDYGKHCRT